MKETFFEWVERHRWTLFVGLVVFAALFWYGYQGMKIPSPSLTAQTPPEIKEPAPLKIPREYSPSDSLLDLKIERDREKSREMEQVQDLLNKVGLTDETRKQAEEELWRLTQATAKERQLETLLKARGYEESMVSITPKLVTVVVVGKLDPQKANEIGQATAEVTTYTLDQIEIVER